MNAPQFRYTANRATLHSIPVGMDASVDVVGDPEFAAYEWVIRRGRAVQSHSDDAYGSPEVALRDGLIAWCGMPSDGAAESSQRVQIGGAA